MNYMEETSLFYMVGSIIFNNLKVISRKFEWRRDKQTVSLSEKFQPRLQLVEKYFEAATRR